MKKVIADQTTNRITFEEIYELDCDGKRVVMFQIPAAPRGIPIAYQGHYYGRDNESLGALNIYEIEAIRNQGFEDDWSREIVKDATIDDLDPIAIAKAREKYIEKHPDMAGAVVTWDDLTFLDKAKLTINGQITRTALLLLGKEEAAHHLDHISQIVWKLQTDEETAADIYTIPYLLSTNKLLQRIRNYRIKIYPQNSLVPAEVWKYDTESILEALHNCIAHQDYIRKGRVVVTEHKDELVFSNQGNFYEGSYEEYVEGVKTPEKYRNPFLVQAMVNLKMIDTQGYGIHKIFLSQRNRYLPMPWYDKSELDKVVLHVPGTVIDADYSLLLYENTDITLTEAYLLDRVQRKEVISDEALALLRKKKLVEGRKNSLFISNKVAKITKQKAIYSRNKGLDDDYYKNLILQAIRDNGSMSRRDITDLLWDKLPEILEDAQKSSKIANLLTALRKAEKIMKAPKKLWVLHK
jgi:ATP-dependent DNA helicase RecG